MSEGALVIFDPVLFELAQILFIAKSGAPGIPDYLLDCPAEEILLENLLQGLRIISA